MPAIAVAGVWTTVASYASAAAVVAGTAYSAYASYQAGKSQQALSNYNATLAERQAQANMQATSNKAALQRQQNHEILKKQEAAYAASGVVASSGSPLQFEVKQAGVLELGAQETEFEGEGGSNYLQNQSQLDIMQGKIAKTAGTMNATASILQGVGSAASGYYGMKR